MDGKGPPRVLVIGGGSAGLLTAHALQMQGAHVTVFEQDAALDARPRDWDFGIYWAQVPLAECLPEDLKNQVEDCQVDDHRAGPDELMPVFNGKTGEPLKAFPIPYNIRLKRRTFLRLLTQGVDVKYSKKLKEVSSDGKVATATFEDGTTETGDLLVGAEGAHSVVREYLLGHEKSILQPTSIVASLAVAQLPAEAVQKWREYAPNNRMILMFHPHGYFSWIGVHDAPANTKPGEWKFLVAQTWRPSDPEYDAKKLQGDSILQDLKTRATEFRDDFNYLWQSVPDDTRCWHNRLTYWVPEPWDNHNGTITLVGDSAHSMTFHRGQGLNNAIHDVALLAQKTKEHGITATAIKAYEDEMLPRGRDAVIESNNNSVAVHNWEQLMQSPLFAKGLKQG